jgi:hypothetical protein
MLTAAAGAQLGRAHAKDALARSIEVKAKVLRASS